jgi:hypothetical protein
MIITKITGGLGNQMFQYAAGKALAARRGEELLIDRSVYGATEKRSFDLDQLNVALRDAPAELIDWNRAPRSRYLRLLRRLPIIGLLLEARPPYRVITERSDGLFMPEVLTATGDVYLSGYWQSEKYFLEIEEAIRREFTLVDELSIEAMAITRQIRATPSVSLHIRRGDYVQNARTNAFHGTCSLEYYAEALRRVGEREPGLHVFLFSDDIAWVKENLKIAGPTTAVSELGLAPVQEMMLMAECRHNIIANSTFSWWGAWLNRHPGKIVIAPKRWFAGADKDTSDLVPESWERI